MPIKNDLVARKARKLLRATYRNLEHKGGWRAVAKRFGLKGPAQAMLMARGERPVCDRMREAAQMNSKRFFRGFVHKVAMPFLESKQATSASRCYSNKGKPL